MDENIIFLVIFLLIFAYLYRPSGKKKIVHTKVSEKKELSTYDKLDKYAEKHLFIDTSKENKENNLKLVTPDTAEPDTISCPKCGVPLELSEFSQKGLHTCPFCDSDVKV